MRTSYVSGSYGSPLSLPCNVDFRPPRWHASHPKTANSRSNNSKTGYLSSVFRKRGFHVDPATRESRMPDSFLRAICSGIAKYWASIFRELRNQDV